MRDYQEGTDDMHEKAQFSALMDELGLSFGDVGRLVGVAPRSVRRWMSPDNPAPPADVWGVLSELSEQMKKQVDNVKSVVISEGLEREHDPKEVTFTYFRNQEHYNEFGRDAGPYGYANACTRAAAHALKDMGYTVVYRFPEAG